jgi:phage-related protein
MEWSVKFYKTEDEHSSVEEWLESIPKSAKAKIVRNMFLLEQLGLTIREPYVKPLGDKLYEVRAKDQNGIYRVIYFAYTGKQFVMLHGFTKKTQKTPPKEIEVAKKRMEKFINE